MPAETFNTQALNNGNFQKPNMYRKSGELYYCLTQIMLKCCIIPFFQNFDYFKIKLKRLVLTTFLDLHNFFCRFGRKSSAVVCLVLGGGCGIGSAFSVNIIMFGCLRFITAACFVGVGLLNHVSCKFPILTIMLRQVLADCFAEESIC